MQGKSRPSHIRLLKPFPVSLINREYTVKVSALIVQWKVSFRLGKVGSWKKNLIVQRDFKEKPCQDLAFVWVLEPLLTSYVSKLHPKDVISKAYPNFTKNDKATGLIVLSQGPQQIRRQEKNVIIF